MRHFTSGIYATALKTLSDALEIGGLPHPATSGSINHLQIAFRLYHHVRIAKNSSSSLATVLSTLRAACTRGMGWRWDISPAEEDILHQQIKRYQKELPANVRQAAPVSRGLMEQIFTALKPRMEAGDMWAIQMWTLHTVVLLSLARMGEV